MTPADRRRTAPHREPSPAGPQCAVGETLCRIRVLTERQWDALPPGRRPAQAKHYLGLGWVVALVGGDD